MRGVRGSCDLVDRVAEARDAAGPRDARVDRALRAPRRSGVVGRLGARVGERLGEEPRGVLDHAEEHAPAPEQPGGDRALDRLRRAGVA